jgi:hypothetical protein
VSAEAAWLFKASGRGAQIWPSRAP